MLTKTMERSRRWRAMLVACLWYAILDLRCARWRGAHVAAQLHLRFRARLVRALLQRELRLRSTVER